MKYQILPNRAYTFTVEAWTPWDQLPYKQKYNIWRFAQETLLVDSLLYGENPMLVV